MSEFGFEQQRHFRDGVHFKPAQAAVFSAIVTAALVQHHQPSKHEGITALDLANVLLVGDKSTQFSDVIYHRTTLEEAKSESTEYHRLCNSSSNDTSSFRKVMERIIAQLAKVDAGDGSSNTYHQRPDDISRSNTFDALVDDGDNNSNATSISSNHNKDNASSVWSWTSSSNTQYFDAGKKKQNCKERLLSVCNSNMAQSKACENMYGNSNSVRATSTSNTTASSQSLLESNIISHANAVPSISDATNSTTTSYNDGVIARLEQYKDADKDDPGNRLVSTLLVIKL